jgi:ethanolamine utilization protein EutQ (cupin superfamily)
MAINDVSFENNLAQLAIDNQNSNLELQLAVAVMKSIQDQQKNQAQALLKMIQQSSSLDPAVGKTVNISV